MVNVQGAQPDTDHLGQFFQQYPIFDYDATKPVMSEFYRMCDYFQWDRDSDAKSKAREGIRDAMTKQFNVIYGTNVDDIRSWQSLCRAVDVPIPGGLEACRDKVLSLYVNIVDLVDKPTTGVDIIKYDTVFELSEYTKANGKFFPSENAHAGGVLKSLLRQIMNPEAEGVRRGSSRRRGRGGRGHRGRGRSSRGRGGDAV